MWIALLATLAALVPGATNPDVTQENIHSTICVSGWTKTIRPSVAFTNALKRTQMRMWNLEGKATDYEEDHFIPLELGGAPSDANNLWPEAWEGPWGAHVKDVLETTLHRLVCRGELSLADAQSAIRTDWVASYHHFVENGPHRGRK